MIEELENQIATAVQHNNEDDGFIADREVQYEADPYYASLYMSQEKNPDVYNANMNMIDNVEKSFVLFIKSNEEYSYLRSILTRELLCGDMTSVVVDGNKEMSGILIMINKEDDIYQISVNGETITTEFKNLRPFESFLLRLKSTDICNLFMFIRDKMQTDDIDDIEYFSVFSEYFKITEKKLWASLPYRIKDSILTELDKRTGCNKKRNQESLW